MKKREEISSLYNNEYGLYPIFGWLKSAKGFVLTAAILYAVSIVLFPIYFMFVIVQMILSFVSYSGLKKSVVKDQ